MAWDRTATVFRSALLIRASTHLRCRTVDEQGTSSEETRTVNDMFDRYEREVLPSLGERTQDDYRGHIRTLRGAFGTRPVNELSRREILDYLDKSQTGRVVRDRRLSVLSTVFSNAILWGWADANPCGLIARNAPATSTRKPTEEEYQDLKKRAPLRTKLLMELVRYTGLNTGIVLTLKHSDVDYERGELHYEDPRMGRRVVPLTPELRKTFEQCRKLAPTGDHLIQTEKGKPYTNEGMRAIWQRFMKRSARNGHTRFNFHDIRRMYPRQPGAAAMPLGSESTASVSDSAGPDAPLTHPAESADEIDLADDESFEPIGPVSDAELADQTLLDQPVLESLVEGIQRGSGQVIFAGPPGTGKSHLAMALARFICQGVPGSLEVVQFHPSFSYESFVEGIRPVTRRGSGVEFVRKDGVVLDVVRRMKERGHIGADAPPYVILIDEINRANLPRVLGELMFLLEYRGKTIRLQYSKRFSLPENLFFVGTMNTADRSIRSIDIALRRRFDMFELAPSSRVLSRFLDRNPSEVRGLVDGLEKLNNDLREEKLDRHHAIGHTFLMRPGLTWQGLELLWQRKIFPLIEEYFFDQPDIAASFTLQRYWSRE